MNRKSVIGLVLTFLILLPLLSAATSAVSAYGQIPDFIIDAPHRVEPGKEIPVTVIIHAYLPFKLQSIDIIDDETGHDVASRSYDRDIASNELYYDIFELERNLFASGDTVSIKARFRIKNAFDRVISPVDVSVGSQNLPKWDHWYAGDAHVHSSMTNNILEFGAPVDAIASSAKAIGLDWVILTDHSHDIDPFPGEWSTCKTECEAETTNEFVCSLGEEITCQDEFGVIDSFEPASHYLAYGISSPVEAPDTWGRDRNPTQQGAINDVRDNKGGVSFIAHPFNWPWDWENWAVQGYTGIEIWNGEKDSEDQQAIAKWESLIKQGKRIFGIGNSDAHDLSSIARYVRTYVDLGNSDLTRDNIIRALRNGRFIVSDGPLLTFTVDDHNMGDAFTPSDHTVELRISWKSTTEYGSVRRIDISVGEQVESVPVNSFEDTVTRTFTLLSSELSCCIVSCETDAGKRAYGNPIWVNPMTISGSIQHNDETGTLVDSRYIKVEAWEKQALNDYKIAEGYTNNAGRFAFTLDTDGNLISNEDPGLFESGTRDIYIKYFAENEAARVSHDWAGGLLGITYWGETSVEYDVTGTTWSPPPVEVTSEHSAALSIPALIKADRDWLSSKTGGWARDQLDVLYPDTNWPNFNYWWIYNVMSIPDPSVESWNEYTISHEYGHAIHYSVRGGNLPARSAPVGEEDPPNDGSHWIFSESSGGFALVEGWAQFFGSVRRGQRDPWRNLETNNYWKGADGSQEPHNDPNIDGNTGEIVEGAFASILWDLYDGGSNDEDGVNGGFSNLWTVFKIDQPDRIWSSSANDDFYHYWVNRFGQGRAVDEICIDHGIPVTDDSYDFDTGNDDSATASNLGTVDTSKRVEDLIVVDIDWYRFTTSTQGNVDSEVAIEFDKSRGNLDLFVYRSDGTLVGTGVEFAGGKRVSLDGKNPDMFKIKVVGTGDNPATSGIYEGDFSPNYNLEIALRGRSSGPDSFGYTFIDSNKQGGPSYGWVEISTTGTTILPSSDDSWVGGVGLGFFFNYYGTDYSHLAIGNNGLLFSGTGTSQYVNQPIKQTPSIHGLIAPFWDDIVTWGSAGAIYYQTFGTTPNRKFVVEWYDNQHYYSSTSGITFEAILYEGTNNILFQYKDVDFGSVSGAVGGDNPPYNNGGSATVGIEDPTGNIGLQYSFNEQAVTPSLAILFKFPAFSGTNMYLSMNAPASMDHGNTMIYTLYYNDFGDVAAPDVVLQATLSSNVDFVSASDSGTFDPATRKVTWNIGTVPAFPSGRGSRTITVTIPRGVAVGTVIQTTASIRTSILETRYDDNDASARTMVTGSNLPPNVGVGPVLGNPGGTPSVYWTTPITFTYYDQAATGVDIRIHFDSGGTDITGSMTGGPPNWSYTTTFYPRSGHATVTYTVHYPTTTSQVSFKLYVDPAGYIYDIVTFERIAGASVWLQRPDGQGNWENVPIGQDPAIMQPDVNPQITGADGQYHWDVLEGTYRVHVEAPGYYPADSIAVSVPPPVTDLHVGLTPEDNLPPNTTLLIGSPRLVNQENMVYVTSDTAFTLVAEDGSGGSGIASTGYRIHNSTYSTEWTFAMPPIEFSLDTLSEGTYFVEYFSMDMANNTELTKENETCLIRWKCVFEDSSGRGTTLKVNTEYGLFQFVVPNMDYQLRDATYMFAQGDIIRINHDDGQLRIIAIAVGGRLDVCIASVYDRRTDNRYLLVDRAGVEVPHRHGTAVLI